MHGLQRREVLIRDGRIFQVIPAEPVHARTLLAELAIYLIEFLLGLLELHLKRRVGTWRRLRSRPGRRRGL